MDASHRTNTHRRRHDPGRARPLRDALDRYCVTDGELGDRPHCGSIVADSPRVDSPAVTPGAAECPRCGTTTINCHGTLDCPECSWTEARSSR